MIKENLLSKIKSFFSTLKKSSKYEHIDKYLDILPFIDSYIDRFTGSEISIDFPTVSMLHMNIPKYLYGKYGKDNFEKKTGTNGYILSYKPKNITFIITYTNEGRIDNNVTIKIGNMLTDFIVK